jgi:hypothetical protein
MSKIINLNGVLIDIQRLKAIIHNDHNDCRRLKFVMNNRKEYVWNPDDEKWELEEINEDFYLEFPNNDIAVETYLEMNKTWQENMDNL